MPVKESVDKKVLMPVDKFKAQKIILKLIISSVLGSLVMCLQVVLF